MLLANSDSSASEHAKLLAEKEAQRRGVDLVASGGSASQLVKKSEAAQLVVVGNSHHHGPVAKVSRTPQERRSS